MGKLTDRTHGNANMFQQVAMLWRKLPMPVIAAVHGVCFGGGLQIASGADIRVIAPDARLAVMEMKWGLIPDMGGYALWRGLVRDDVLRELTYTNREFSGAEALGLGFATYVDENPHARAMAIAHEIANRNPEAMREAKALFNEYADMDEDAILMAESDPAGAGNPDTQPNRSGDGWNAEARCDVYRLGGLYPQPIKLFAQILRQGRGAIRVREYDGCNAGCLAFAALKGRRGDVPAAVTDPRYAAGDGNMFGKMRLGDIFDCNAYNQPALPRCAAFDFDGVIEHPASMFE